MSVNSFIKNATSETESTGIGTDLFIRKIGPAAEVGEGYAVDIYEGGVKIDTIKLHKKKDVTNLIKEYKTQYHTNRSFENEKQIHITYKTKEERGETAMQDIDAILFKKASYVGELLKKIIDPLMPIKVREGNVVDGSVNFIPETPGDTNLDPTQVGTMIATKFVEFVSSRQPQPGQEWIKTDELYNPIKKWLSAVRKKLKDYNGIANTPLDMQAVVKFAEGIIQSGDPATIQQATQIQVTPEAAAKIKEIANMKAGNTRPGEGGKPNASVINTIQPDQTAPAPSVPQAPQQVVASLDKNEADKIKGFLNTRDENSPNMKLENDLVQQFGDDHDDVLGDIKDLLKKDDSLNYEEMKLISGHFWEYAKNCYKRASINEVFEEWINSFDNMTLDISKQVWATVNDDLNNLFGHKEAMKTGAELVHLQEFCRSLIEPKFKQLLDHLKTGKRNIEVNGSFELVRDTMKDLMDYSNNDEMKRGNNPLPYGAYDTNPSILADAKYTLEEIIKEISKKYYLDKNIVPVEKKEINDYREKLLAEIRKVIIKPSDISPTISQVPNPNNVNQEIENTANEINVAPENTII